MKSSVSPASTSPTRPAANVAAGFTLVELLVVLVIVALISGVLLSGLERVLDLRTRLSAFLDGVEAPMLVADWFRESVGGLLPDQKDGKERFAGDARHFAGLSTAPLNAVPGVPTAIVWTLAYDADSGRTTLRYRNSGGPEMTIASWPGNYGSLRYCGSDLVCHASWPPNPEASQLPAMIQLDAVQGTAAWPILASPASSLDPYGERR